MIAALGQNDRIVHAEGQHMGETWEKHGRNMGATWEQHGSNMGESAPSSLTMREIAFPTPVYP
eukprot:SAG31_NODE_3660_length_4013_cov_3.345938_3_plen_63_part_00